VEEQYSKTKVYRGELLKLSPKTGPAPNNYEVNDRLTTELERLKLKLGVGFEVNVEWLPGTTRHKKGKQILEEVIGNTVLIYVENFDEAKHLLTHGFLEWLLNQNTKWYIDY